MQYKNFRETLKNITESMASMQAKAAAKKLMIKLYGKGTVTFESHSGGHFVEHESVMNGDNHAHTFDPVTGKISKTAHVTSSYYGESVIHETWNSDLQEANELNEELMEIIEALCEELGVDTQDLLEDVFDKAGQEASNASVNKFSDKSIRAQDDPRVSKAEKMAARMRWLLAHDQRANRFNSKTMYTAKGSRVVKKK